MMITVIETIQFIRKAEKLMSARERMELVNEIAANPEEGDIIPQTGGVRKMHFTKLCRQLKRR
jgi:hypothetical protein